MHLSNVLTCKKFNLSLCLFFNPFNVFSLILCLILIEILLESSIYNINRILYVGYVIANSHTRVVC